MRKVIAAMNMTLDGVCDHTVGIVDEALHQHYARLINASGAILYGRTTYQLMQYWQTVLQEPSAEASMTAFAQSIDRIPKIVFSHTMKETGWESAQLAQQSLADTVRALRQEAGGDILVGSRSLIVQLLNEQLIDELQLCIHPIIEGKGLRLFDPITRPLTLALLRTQPFASGVVLHYYQPLPAEERSAPSV